ncbi:MAG TPA: helix-turn-helix transcriptional regulator [Tepidisphaeraceae bacterium]|jgi:ribosome-binding protein aMBF1 (putative translation factor)
MKKTKLSDEIRRAVDDSGLSRYRIAKEIDVAESTMSRFMAGKGGLRMNVLDRLAALIGIHVTSKKER